VLAAWSGLGYYRRARMLHAGARAVLQHHGGVIPSEAALLRELPGVGRYTAGAIASIAFGRREPVVDGNVERVLTRWDAIAGDPRRGPVREQLWSLAAHFADGPNPGDVNQSLMELGATICLPSNPGCGECSIAATCRARVHGDPERFPQKAARAAVRDERWWALIGTDQRGERVWLEKRGPGRWHGMLLPPIGQGQPELVGARRVEPCGTVRHVLTHAAMEFEVYRGVVSAPVSRGELVALRTLDARAIPQVTRRLIARALEAQSTERSAARTPRASAVASNTSPARRASKSR
jgi:A/G-specific adenine glycosylase